MVKVQYVKGGKTAEMKPVFANVLLKMGTVRPYVEPAAPPKEKPAPVVETKIMAPEKPVGSETGDGAPKREYKRRDMKAED